MSDAATELSYPMQRSCPFDPPDTYAQLRADEPFARVRLWDGTHPYLLTRFADIKVVLGHPRFSCEPNRPGFPHVFEGRKVLYSWIGGTRRDWRGQGHFRALTEESETWAHANGFHEVVVKTKNRFYDMRGTLDQLEFDVIKYEVHGKDNRESKVYLSKRLTSDVLKSHTSNRTVIFAE